MTPFFSIALAAVPVHAGGPKCAADQVTGPCAQKTPAKSENPDKPAKPHLKPGTKISNAQAVHDPSKYSLDPFGSYYFSGEYIYRVDRSTMKILDLVGRTQDLLK